MKLQFNQFIVNTMTRSAARNYHAPIPDSVVPVSVISTQMSDMTANSNNQKLQIISHTRKYNWLLHRNDDHKRLMFLLQQEEMPGIPHLMTVHCRSGGSVKAFIKKCQEAAE